MMAARAAWTWSTGAYNGLKPAGYPGGHPAVLCLAHRDRPPNATAHPPSLGWLHGRLRVDQADGGHLHIHVPRGEPRLGVTAWVGCAGDLVAGVAHPYHLAGVEGGVEPGGPVASSHVRAGAVDDMDSGF